MQANRARAVPPNRSAHAVPSAACRSSPRSESGRTCAPGRTTPGSTPSCSPTATGATSSTGTGTGATRRSSPTSTLRRHPFHVAIENWAHDFNIGSVVRTANAFLAAAVHIVGRRRWNRRGAMVTDRYQHVRAPRRRRGPARVGRGRRGCRCSASTTCRARCRSRRTSCRAPACCCSARRARACRTPARAACRRRALDRAVRLDPVDQRRRRGGHRDARLGAPARLRPAPTPGP